MAEIYCEEELLEELRRLNREHDRVTVKILQEHSEISRTPYVDRFGGWNEAKKAAGLEAIHPFHRKPANGITGQEYIGEIFKWTSCQRCGLEEEACIVFHHYNGDGQDNMYISRADHDSQRMSSDKVLEELKKTIPLCANCHKRNHSDKHKFVATENMVPDYPHPTSFVEGEAR